MQTSTNISELAKALCSAQAQLKPAAFDSKNPHFGSKYASLNSVMDAIKLPLSANGLCLVQTIGTTAEGKYVLNTALLHVSGEFITDSFLLLIDKPTMQGLGSAISYAKRYAISAIVGVCSDEDDDGNHASSKHQGAIFGPGHSNNSSDTGRIAGPRPLRNELGAIAVHDVVDNQFDSEEAFKAKVAKIAEGISRSKGINPDKEEIKAINPTWPEELVELASWVCPIGKESKGKILYKIPLETLSKILEHLRSVEKPSKLDQFTQSQIELFLDMVTRIPK